MRKWTALALCALLCLTLLAGCGEKEEARQLNLYTWEGMFPQEVLDGFTEETGITINYVNFDTDETMLAKLQETQGGSYDLVIADDYIIETVIAEGLAQKLDPAKIANIGNVNAFYQGQFYDPADEYTVPYGAGVQTIVYRPSAVDVDIKGYADLWDESLANEVGIISNFRVVNGMALKVLGQSYNTEDLDVIRSAGEKMQELAPSIRLIKDDNIQDDLVLGEINAAVMYTSQVTMAMLSPAGPDLKVVYPQEGIGFGIMAGFIPSNAPDADAAHAFLEYLLRPEVSAPCFEWLGYYCTNAAADDLITPEFQSFLTLPDNFTGDMEMIENVNDDCMAEHLKIFTEFRTACGQ